MTIVSALSIFLLGLTNGLGAAFMTEKHGALKNSTDGEYPSVPVKKCSGSWKEMGTRNYLAESAFEGNFQGIYLENCLVTSCTLPCNELVKE